jgi:hypothetical protein
MDSANHHFYIPFAIDPSDFIRSGDVAGKSMVEKWKTC